jgi:hypothetical protein
MNTILSNDLKKGDMVILHNGWKAKIEDNKKGNIRMATVYGLYTEMGSIYSHDVKGRINDDNSITTVVPTVKQQELRRIMERM